MTAEKIVKLIQKAISDWHKGDNHNLQSADFSIRKFGDHREEVDQVITDLAVMNTEMWHLQDKFRSENDAVVLDAIKAFNPLNQRRNDLIEEIDEIFLDNFGCQQIPSSFLTADEILRLIQDNIVDWHKNFTPESHTVVTEDIKNLSVPENDMRQSVQKLILAHLEMWHEEDKIHGDSDDIIVEAVRNSNILNLYRNKLIENLDQMFIDHLK